MGGIFSVFLTTALTACKKEIIATQDEAQKETMLVERLGLTADGKLLKFATLEAYEKAVDHEQAELQEEMLTSIKKASFPNYFSNSTVIEKNANAKEDHEMDDFLGQLLNKDGAVQIGEHIYKVDLQKEKVFVIEVKNSISDYSDLINGRTSNKNVKEYSFDDDVLELVESGVENQQNSLLCNEDHLGNRYVETSVYDIPGYGGVFKFWGDADYRRYGIYYSIVTTARSTVQGQIRIYVQLENVWHHQRCGNTVGPYSHPWYQSNPATHNFQKHKSYSGSKALNGLHTKFRIRCEIPGVPQGGNTYSTYFTEWRVIQVNNPVFP